MPPQNQDGWKAIGGTLLAGLLGLGIWQLIALERPEPTEQRIFIEARLDNADEIARNFATWRDTTLRLKELCAKNADPKATVQDPTRKSLVDARSAAHDALVAAFGAAAIYFGSGETALIREISGWEKFSRSDACDLLPTIDAVEAMKGKLASALLAAVAPANLRK